MNNRVWNADDTARSRTDLAVLLIPGLITAIVHVLTSKGFGYFSDEFYYIACSNRLDFGYVDHPPLSILLLRADRWLFGDSLMSIRLLPAIAMGLTVILTGLLARRLGAGRFGQLLAQVCVMVAPVYLGVGHTFSMNAFDGLFWLGALCLLVLIFDGGSPRLWIVFGLVAGLGLQNKISLLFLGFGLVVGLVLTAQRRQFLCGWIWAGGLVAGLMFLPHVLWQISHGWPTLEFMENARLYKNVRLSLPAFCLEQFRQMHPFTFPVWLAGLCLLLFSRAYRKFQALGWCYLAILALFVLAGGKSYYLAPAYTMLFAFGALWFEKKASRTVTRTAVLAVIVAGGIVTLPLAMPVLPVETHIRYAALLGQRPDAGGERHEVGRLSQYFASMFGWENMVGEVARVYQALPVQDREKCGIFCMEYHQAGAVDFLGRKHGLPPASSGHNNYWLWGPHGSWEVGIVITRNPAELSRFFDSVSTEGRIHDDTGYVMPSENNLTLCVVRGPKTPIGTLWARVKHFD